MWNSKPETKKGNDSIQANASATASRKSYRPTKVARARNQKQLEQHQQEQENDNNDDDDHHQQQNATENEAVLLGQGQESLESGASGPLPLFPDMAGKDTSWNNVQLLPPYPHQDNEDDEMKEQILRTALSLACRRRKDDDEDKKTRERVHWIPDEE